MFVGAASQRGADVLTGGTTHIGLGNQYFSFVTGWAASPYQIVTWFNAAIYSGAPLYYSLDIAWDPGRPA